MLAKQYEVKPLSEKDRQRLRNQYWIMGGFTVFAGMIFYVIFTNVLSGIHQSQIPVIIFSVFAIIFAGIVVALAWQNHTELALGIKHCYTGRVSDKRFNKHVSTSTHHSGGIRGGHRSTRTTTRISYYLNIDGEELKVNAQEYHQAATGDTVYLEVSPKKQYILTFQVLEHTASVQPAPGNSGSHSTAIEQEKHYAISAREREVVKTLFFRRWRKSLYFALAVGVLFLPVFTTGLIIFTLPLGAYLIFKTYRLLRALSEYNHFTKSLRAKSVTQVRINDKITETSNRAKTKYCLITSQGRLAVPVELYETVNKSDVIDLHRAAHVNITYAAEHKPSRTLIYFNN